MAAGAEASGYLSCRPAAGAGEGEGDLWLNLQGSVPLFAVGTGTDEREQVYQDLGLGPAAGALDALQGGAAGALDVPVAAV